MDGERWVATGTASDADLMAALGRQDMEAFAHLVHRHQERLRALAFRFTGRWDVADDVTQEVFLRLLRSASTYRPTAAFSTWLYRIVVNICLDGTRRPKLMSMGEIDPPAEGGSSADRPLLREEARLAVQREVAALPARQRIALLLHRFEGLGHAQIAAATGWSESAVESLLVRAYAQLRDRLRDWADG